MIAGEVLWPLAPLELHDAVALFMAACTRRRTFVRSDRLVARDGARAL